MDVMEKIVVVRGNERSLFSLCLVVERKAGLMTVRKQPYHAAISSSVEYCLHPSAYLSAVLEII